MKGPRPPKPSAGQLGLFSPSPEKAPPAAHAPRRRASQAVPLAQAPDAPALVVEPRSPTTGGFLSALEAGRVQRGMSIEPAGLLLAWKPNEVAGAACPDCARYVVVCIGYPLYQPSSKFFGELEAEEYQCGRCGKKFRGHRDESIRAPIYMTRGVNEQRRR